MTTGVIIVAAGRGTRFGGDIPKQYRFLAGKSVLQRTLECFLRCQDIDFLQVVIHKDDLARYEDICSHLGDRADRLKPPVFGGTTRQDSVFMGVKALTDVDIILVHDAARPFVSKALIQRALDAAARSDAAVPGVAVTDTIRQMNANDEASATLPRETLHAIQTPQVFHRKALYNAHLRAEQAGLTTFSDDGALMEWAGHKVSIFKGEPSNIKLTYEADFASSEHKLETTMTKLMSRTGIGYDVHATCEGDHVWLGGVKIPHNKGLLAHSDGDVVLHALTDAVLGAVGDGDIGTHFPPSHQQWKGASSDQFLAFACHRVRELGGVIDYLDCVLLCESPRLSPYRTAIRKRIAEIAGLPETKVSIKATTMERLGFVGREEGIAAQAVATIRIPEDL